MARGPNFLALAPEYRLLDQVKHPPDSIEPEHLQIDSIRSPKRSNFPNLPRVVDVQFQTDSSRHAGL
jgi:hypothetical protein